MTPQRATTQLDDEQIAALCERLAEWQLSADRTSLSISYKFASFRIAFAFLTEIALAAEACDHHPEWSNNYKTVSLKLTTHSVKGLSVLDEMLAEMIATTAARYGAKIWHAS